MMALSRPDVDIIAITTCFGNVSLDKTTYNTLRILKTCDRLDVPIYRGSENPLLVCHGHRRDSAYHGKDGLGDVVDADPADIRLVQSEHASLALVRLVNQYQGQITLVALAPLTNIALALKLDHEFGQKLNSIVVMGGNIEGKGTTTPSAEFNFFSDPEAASVVFHEMKPQMITLISWESCLHNALSWDWFDKFHQIDTPLANFNHAITAIGVHRNRNVRKLPVYRTCDPVAMFVALERSAILESELLWCDVELKGELTRGQMVVDWLARLEKPANVIIVKRIGKELYASYMEKMVM